MPIFNFFINVLRENKIENYNLEHSFEKQNRKCIRSSGQETLSLSKDVKNAAEKQQKAISEVVENIAKIVSVSDQTAKSTSEVLNSAEELDNSMQEINQTTENLAEVASELKSRISQFKLKA